MEAETSNMEEFLKLFVIPLEPARLLTKSLMDFSLNLHVSGVENIPDTGGGILVCNHTDAVDILVQAIYSPRKLIFLSKAELFEQDRELKGLLYQEGSPLNSIPFLFARPLIDQILEFYAMVQRVYLKEWGGRPVIRNYRGSGAKDAVAYYHDLEEQMLSILNDGEMLAIYPEGTRTTTGMMGPFKPLAAKLAIEAGVPIVPAGLGGAFGFSSAKNILSGGVFASPIHYRVGAPIHPEDFPKGPLRKAARELSEMLEERVYDLTVPPSDG